MIPVIRHVARGAAAGLLATGAMSAVMLAGERAGLLPGQPPRHIVRAALPGHRRRPKRGEKALGAGAHLAFGMGSGALLGLLARDGRVRLPLGVGYGLLIWVTSYEGWVPAMDILPPISRDPEPGRPAVMAAGHVVYGAALALALNRLRRRGTAATQP
ncbi:hypothetical protein GCM10009530_39270 [Microbispora corallina]|uniref:DUF1440 domain-containing protein n=1 Tax=Microbispora corallina TaxID=83302 RepID=A0ABQ4G8P3_9ACTN|nr:DUF1440 domain-containing protein [Microbispora corallina]GIH43400.1 hypothetical protein Mco01_64000 [Microbispora corallina]